MDVTPAPDPLEGVRAHYGTGEEADRLEQRYGPLERERTLEVLLRHLPPAPVVIADVGGGAGPYALELAGRGYEVHLRDLSPVLVDEARRRAAATGVTLASAEVADARALDLPDGSTDVVLLLGPLYHLQEAGDRARALAEARRVLRPGGLLAAAAISRAAPVLDGFLLAEFDHPAHRPALDEVARTGRYDAHPDLGFTDAFFHTPALLRTEVTAAGFELVELVGLEGGAFLLGDLDERWTDPGRRALVLEAARRLEGDDSVLGVSPHLLAVGRAA